MNHITKDTIFCLSNCFIFVFVCLFVYMDLIPFSFIYFKICFWCLLDRKVRREQCAGDSRLKPRSLQKSFMDGLLLSQVSYTA